MLVVSACVWGSFGAGPAPDAAAQDASSNDRSEHVVEAPAPPAFDPARVTEANVVEVLDGDSIVLLIDGELRRFEIQGADAPEWIERQPNKSPASLHAKRFLTNMLEGERVAVLEPEPGWTDQLRRRRGYVYRLPDRTLVDLEIVRQGYGKVSTRAGEPFEPVLRWYEARAKELTRGIWGPLEAAEEHDAPLPAATTAPTTRERPVAPEPKPSDEPDPADDGWVWITKSGSKYHREGCQHLSNSRKRVRRDAVDATHQPCRTCNPG